MTRRSLEELNVLDDFLFQEMITRDEEGKQFCRILLKTILGKNIGQVKVIPQKSILGGGTNQHGIKIDAYIEAEAEQMSKEDTDVEVQTEIYDIEPNKYPTKSEARRTRYYHALIDTKILKSGAEYEKLKNVVIIMILPYDPFGKNRMVYTIKRQCVEDTSVSYKDGATTIYLYTKGVEGNPSQELRDMLQYLENSIEANVKNHDLANIHKLMNEVKHDEEVGISYMKSWELEQIYKETGRQEGIKEGIKALVETCEEIGISQEETLQKIQQKFSLSQDAAQEYIKEYWK